MHGGLPALKTLSGIVRVVMCKLVADLAETLPIISASQPAQLL
jgi:hypothetical protein